MPWPITWWPDDNDTDEDCDCDDVPFGGNDYRKEVPCKVSPSVIQ